MAIIPQFTSRASAPGPVQGLKSGAIAKGQGMQQLGQALGQLAVSLRERQRVLDEQKNRVALAGFDADLQAKRTELLLQSQTEGDPEGLTDRMLKEFNSYTEQRRQELDKMRDIGARVTTTIESHRAAFEPRLLGVENTRRQAVVQQDYLETMGRFELAAFRDPASVEAIKARAWEAIEDMADAAGVPPESILDEQEKITGQLYTSAVRGMIGQNPARTLSELEGGKFDEFLRDVDIIRKLTGEAEQAVRVQEAEHRRAQAASRNRFKALMRDDLVSLSNTGVGLPNIEAQAAALLDEDEFDAYVTQRDLAKEQHARLKEMEFAPTSDIVAILDDAEPVAGTEGFADEFQNYQASQKAAMEILKARDVDPAGFANRAPEIADAFALAEGEPKLLQQALESRVGFQREMGISDPRVLSKAEAGQTAMQINQTPPSERAGVLAGMELTYGDYYNVVMSELEADQKIDSRTRLLADYASNPIVSHLLAQTLETGSTEIKKNIPKASITLVRETLQQEIEPFKRAFSGSDPTGGATRKINDIQSAIEDMAFILYNNTGDEKSAARQAYEHVIGNEFEVLDTSRVSAYMPKVIGGEIVNGSDVEDAAEVLLSRERIEAFDPQPILTGFDEPPEVTRERTVSTAINSGVWVTNQKADGLVLMLPFVGGGLQVLRDAGGKPYEMKFTDAMGIMASQPARRGESPEADISTGIRQGIEIQNRQFEELRQRARQ